MIHCFYHSSDLDGHCSGAIVKYRFPDAVMHPINYGDGFPWDEIKEDDKVYMVDFALQPFSDMVRLSQSCFLIWIDHHKSAIESRHAIDDMKWNGPSILDPNKAACELTWEYLFPDRQVPLAVKLLSLYDSWTYQGHELEDMVLPFQMRMKMEELDPKDWDYEAGRKGRSLWIKLFSDKKIWHEGFRIDPEDIIDIIVAEGRLLLRYDEANKAKYAKTYAFETVLSFPYGLNAPGGYDWQAPEHDDFKAIAVNLGHTNSKVLDPVWRRKCPECSGSGMIYDCLDHTGCVSDHKLPCPTCHNSGYLEPYDLMITFVRRPDKLWHVSLYSTKEDVDCGAIAKSFGGGGHKGAADFRCKELPFEY